MRISTLLLAGAVVFSAPAALAQDVVVERDGTSITITRPDGTVEHFTVAEEASLRVRVKDGPLSVEREDGALHERLLRHREGERPRAFAFRTAPDGARFEFEGLEDFELGEEADSLIHRMLRFRGMPSGLGMSFDGEHMMPWPGFGGAGVDLETRREIAEGERESRELARKFRRAEGAERERLTRELRDTLERTFDAKQQARREQIEHLRENADRIQSDLSELETERAERERARREIIERRQGELLGESDELDW